MLGHRDATAIATDTLEEALEETIVENRCCHHWIIETANGPVSQGTCQICWETREFRNSIVEENREY